MKKGCYFLIWFVVFGLYACNNNVNKQETQNSSAEKSVGEKFADAYRDMDWETVVSLGDSLIDEKDTMNLTIAYAEALAATGNPRKAIYVLDKKLELNPEDYYLYQTKGNVYCTIEKYDSALINYDIVIKMKPSNARPYINEGAIYEILGDKEKAIVNYLAAIRLFSSHNYHQETVEFAKRVLILDSTNVEARKILYVE